MLHEDLLARINELANKKKTEGLTDEELKEQQDLRQVYLKGFRSSFANTIEGMKIVDKEGNDLTSDKVKKIQKERGLHSRQNEDK